MKNKNFTAEIAENAEQNKLECWKAGVMIE